MLKAALKLKDALVLRCSGMALQHGGDEKGPWLKITYYDEDGADVSERFRLQTPAQRTAFEQLFIRPHTRTPGVPLRWITPADIVTQQALLRHPDCRRPHEGAVLAGAGKSVRLSGAFSSRQRAALISGKLRF